MCLRIVGGYLVLSTAVFLIALAVDVDTAVNVMSRLHTDAGDATVYTALSATLVPNAALFAGSYLLGPGFTVGIGTLVSPTAGRRSARCRCSRCSPRSPTTAPTPAWTPYLLVLPLLLAALAAARAQRRNPTLRWDEGALRGCAGGVAGRGAPRRARCSSPAVPSGRAGCATSARRAFDVLVHAITAFGIGGLLGGLAMTWWQRRASRRATQESTALDSTA